MEHSMHLLVSLMVINAVPHLGFALSLFWVTPGTHAFCHCLNTYDPVRAIALWNEAQCRAFVKEEPPQIEGMYHHQVSV